MPGSFTEGLFLRRSQRTPTKGSRKCTELAQKVTTEIAAKDWRHGDTKESRKVA
jgi:hypothetical protein